VSNVLTIAQKELKSYFASPIAYIVIGFFALVFGWFYYVSVAYFLQASLQMGMPGAGQININSMAIRPLLQNVAVIALFMLPLITMRTYAEEKRTGTIELLATSPITDLQIVLGKFLAAAGLYLLMIVAGLFNLVLLWMWSANPPEWKPVVTASLGLLLFGSCFIALGTFISTLTRNQIVAGILSFCLFLGVWALDWFKDLAPGSAIGDLLGYLSVTSHLEDLMKGVLDLKDVVYYLSVIAFGLFISHQSVESQRWRA
jgi:ABC-2 type transport system permease protein